ncbi:unnamed protein product, partial [marine sediment metagenome]
FRVTDPAKVQSLKLTVSYHGGAAVYLNGKEVARGHLATGAKLAEAYPVEAFVGPDGKLMVFGRVGRKRVMPTEEDSRRMALRRRTLEVKFPTQLLRKGVNVLALEIVRAPYHKVVDEQKTQNWDGAPLYNLRWNTCQLLEARLTSTTAEGVEPNLAGHTAGLQVWNSSVLRTDFALDSGDPCEVLQPITLATARNGISSDKVVIGSSKPIRALKATPSELRGAGGTIPASALRVRYAAPGPAQYGVYEYTYGFGEGRIR